MNIDILKLGVSITYIVSLPYHSKIPSTKQNLQTLPFYWLVSSESSEPEGYKVAFQVLETVSLRDIQ